MIIAIDAHYEESSMRVAGCLVGRWSDDVAAAELYLELPAAAEYVPGEFYRRELPAILALLQRLEVTHRAVKLDAIVIDGFVDLGPERPGLGRHLHEALQGHDRPAVVGVAKSPFQGAPALQVRRGTSTRPLFVTAAGIDVAVAAIEIGAMAGPYRVPWLLKRADRLARDGS